MISKNPNLNEHSEKLNSLLLIYIKAVFTEQLNYSDGTYRIGYGHDWRDESELHPTVMEQFGIRIFFVDKQRSDYPLNALCVLTDKLGDIFKKHHVSPFLIVTFQNNDTDFIELTEKNNLSLIDSCRLLSSTIKTSNDYDEFLEAVSKELLFTTIKFS